MSSSKATSAVEVASEFEEKEDRPRFLVVSRISATRSGKRSIVLTRGDCCSDRRDRFRKGIGDATVAGGLRTRAIGSLRSILEVEIEGGGGSI